MEESNSKPLINFRVTPELRDRLKRAAKTEDVSQTTFAKQAIEEKIIKVEKKIVVPLDK